MNTGPVSTYSQGEIHYQVRAFLPCSFCKEYKEEINFSGKPDQFDHFHTNLSYDSFGDPYLEHGEALLLAKSKTPTHKDMFHIETTLRIDTHSWVKIMVFQTQSKMFQLYLL